MDAPLASTIAQKEAPKLRERRLVPLFYLPSVGGGKSGPSSLRSKYNMVLIFVEGGPEGEGYLCSLSDSYREIQAEQAKVIAVVPLQLPDAQDLAARLKLPYTLLADEHGATTRRMLGDDQAALCVADRYGQAFYVGTAPTAAALPTVQIALDWLDHIQIQCPE